MNNKPSISVTYSDDVDEPQYGQVLHLSIDLETRSVHVYQDTPRRPTDGYDTDELYGIVRVYRIGRECDDYTHADPDEVRELLAPDGAAYQFIQTILDNHSAEFGGPHGIAVLNWDGETAEEDLSLLLEGVTPLNVIDYTCEDWFCGGENEIAEFESEEEARAWAETAADEGNSAAGFGAVLDGDPGDYVAEMWHELHEEDEES